MVILNSTFEFHKQVRFIPNLPFYLRFRCNVSWGGMGEKKWPLTTSPTKNEGGGRLRNIFF